MARQLNALLLQIEFAPRGRMVGKEQLPKMFALEIEAMHAEIEALDRITKRRGTLRDPVHRAADRQVGWAYRLLQAYGATEELSFDEAGDACKALLEAGAHVDDIPFIAATYNGERADALSIRNGQAQSPFLRDVLHRMAQVGLDDTVLNREAATEEIYRARADALLTSADDPRLPKLGQTDRAKRMRIESYAATPPPTPAALWTADPASTPAERQPIVNSTNVVPKNRQSIASTSLSEAKPRKNLPLDEFDDQVEKLIANHRDDWEPDTTTDVRVLVRTFRSILEEHDVRHSGQITQEHVAALRQHFNGIYARYGQSPRLRTLSTRELREESLRLVDEAASNGEKPIKLGLSAATIRRHLGNLDHFLKHLRSHYFAVPEWTFEGLRPKKPPRGEIRLQQVKPGPDEIRPLFDIPIFVGRKSSMEPDIAGDMTYHGALYFLPLLYTYLGPRRNEFAGLMPDEIIERDGHWAIHIKTNEIRRIKNAQSNRLLPVPSELLRLNFLEYVGRLKALGHTQLFPELFSPYLKRNNPGDRFYKDFVPVVKRCMPDTIWERPIHALRHGFADTLRQAGVQDGVIDDLSGRLGETETGTRYTNPAGLTLLRLSISAYPIITGHLEPQPIQLLPWVEQKTPPPWAGKKNGDRFGDKRGRRPKKKC